MCRVVVTYEKMTDRKLIVIIIDLIKRQILQILKFENKLKRKNLFDLSTRQNGILFNRLLFK